MQAHEPYGFRLWRDTFDFLRGEKKGHRRDRGKHTCLTTWLRDHYIYSRERTFALLILLSFEIVMERKRMH